MNRRHFVLSTFACVSGLSARWSFSQSKQLQPDLAELVQGNHLKAFNRTASSLKDAGRAGAHLNELPGDGVAYLDEIEFASGTIELDIRGKDVQQQRFVGVAFHGMDRSTYDAVYFRPFNFKSQDPARKIHAVQYISHPTFTWQKLRDEHPGKYEQPVNPIPDPNGWFHARIVIANS